MGTFKPSGSSLELFSFVIYRDGDRESERVGFWSRERRVGAGGWLEVGFWSRERQVGAGGWLLVVGSDVGH